MVSLEWRKAGWKETESQTDKTAEILGVPLGVEQDLVKVLLESKLGFLNLGPVQIKYKIGRKAGMEDVGRKAGI